VTAGQLAPAGWLSAEQADGLSAGVEPGVEGTSMSKFKEQERPAQEGHPVSTDKAFCRRSTRLRVALSENPEGYIPENLRTRYVPLG
jgi:hypothetical protein